ncbi:MAG: hypothetical protein J5753_02880 [Oscillospiraceae bacterium]|nr:hypothetical protein [Oscillospiraceae bacterium]
MNKLITAAAAVLMLLTAVTPLHAAAETPPQDMHLTVETKELKADEIREDGYVELKVFAENLPAFRSMQILLEKDSGLSYSADYADPCAVLSRAGGVSFSLGSGAFPDIIGCNIAVVEPEPLSLSGEIITLHLFLPDHVQPGDFYRVRILRSHDDTYHDETFVETDEALYGESYFTVLAAGGIRIQSDKPAPPVQHDTPEPQQQAAPEPQQNEDPEPDAAETTGQTETTAPADHTTTAASVTEALTTSAPEPTEALCTETTDDLTTETQTSKLMTTGAEAAPVTETNPQAPEKHSAWPLVLLGIAGIGAGAGAAVWRRKRKMQQEREGI